MRVFRVINEDAYQLLLSKVHQHPDEEPVQEGGGTGKWIEYVPIKYQEKAAKLLALLEQSPGFKINSDGSFQYQGVNVAGSHISDLITIAVSPLFTGKRNWPGIIQFASVVKQVNVPQHMLASPFIKYLEEEKSLGKGWIQRRLQ